MSYEPPNERKLKCETEGHSIEINDKKECSDGPKARVEISILSLLNFGVTNKQRQGNIPVTAEIHVRETKLGSKGRGKGGQLRLRQTSVLVAG